MASSTSSSSSTASSSTSSSSYSSSIDPKFEKEQATCRSINLFIQLEKWQNTIALTDVDRVHVLCDILDFLFTTDTIERGREWDDYWLSLGSFAVSWGKIDGVTALRDVGFSNYAVSCKNFAEASLSNSKDLKRFTKELRESSISFLRVLPLYRVIRYIEDIIATGMDTIHFSLDNLTKYSEKYDKNIIRVIKTVNKGNIASADLIINLLSADGIKLLMERLHESPNHNTGGQYRGEI